MIKKIERRSQNRRVLSHTSRASLAHKVVKTETNTMKRLNYEQKFQVIAKRMKSMNNDDVLVFRTIASNLTNSRPALFGVNQCPYNVHRMALLFESIPFAKKRDCYNQINAIIVDKILGDD